MPKSKKLKQNPKIWLGDKEAEKNLNNQHPEMRGKIRCYTSPLHADERVTVFGYVKREIIKRLQNYGATGTDIGIMFLLMMNVSDARIALADQPQEVHAGKKLYELVRPGCRLLMSEKQMASLAKCSVGKIRQTIGLLKKCDVICNWGKGWIEFDAWCCWNGSLEIHTAYAAIQPEHSSKELSSNLKVII